MCRCLSIVVFMLLLGCAAEPLPPQSPAFQGQATSSPPTDPTLPSEPISASTPAAPNAENFTRPSDAIDAPALGVFAPSNPGETTASNAPAIAVNPGNPPTTTDTQNPLPPVNLSPTVDQAPQQSAIDTERLAQEQAQRQGTDGFPYLWGRYSLKYWGGSNQSTAATRLNGIVVPNGANFNANEHFWPASYIDNALGICDNSTALFRVVGRVGVDATMQTENQRYNTTHADYEKVRYFGWPGDEAVVWKEGATDMSVKFKNDTGMDLRITMTYKSGLLTAELWGTGPLIREVRYEWINREWSAGNQISLKRSVYERGNLLGEGIFTSRYGSKPRDAVREDFFAPRLELNNVVFTLEIPGRILPQ